MLFAKKTSLLASTAVQILSVRQQELSYYTRNILNIGSQAALLSGFAFKTLVSYRSVDLLEWIHEFAGDKTFVLASQYPLDATQVAMTTLELLYLTSTISGM